jgi:hypothetical protein
MMIALSYSPLRHVVPVATVALFVACSFSIIQNQVVVVPQPTIFHETDRTNLSRVNKKKIYVLRATEDGTLPLEPTVRSSSMLTSSEHHSFISSSTPPKKGKSEQPPEEVTSPVKQPASVLSKNPPAEAATVAKPSFNFPWNPLLENWEPPKWITNYMDWHTRVRSTHPAFNATRATNDTLPPLLIVYCRRWCGGLHDRLGSLPFDLYLANQTKRLLMYVWEDAAALEEFLIPNRLNWTLNGLHHPQLANLRKGTPKMFDIYKRGDSGTSEVFWNETLPNEINIASNHSIPVFTTQLRTHNGEFFFESLLKGLGETDMIHTTPTFGWIWQAMFQPSPGLESYIDRVRQNMNLAKGQYTAIHVRLHYPTMLKEHAKGLGLQSLHGHPSFDRAGLLLEGPGKEFAVTVGIHAVQCARKLTANDDEPLYFFSDANNLVEYLAQRNHSETHNRTDEFDVDQRADQVLSQVNVVARPDIHQRNHHLDFHHSSNPRDYYSIFADLYLAMEARCITFGYGGFARFAQQLTKNSCYLQHQLHIHSPPFFGHALNMHGNVCTRESYESGV